MDEHKERDEQIHEHKQNIDRHLQQLKKNNPLYRQTNKPEKKALLKQLNTLCKAAERGQKLKDWDLKRLRQQANLEQITAQRNPFACGKATSSTAQLAQATLATLETYTTRQAAAEAAAATKIQKIARGRQGRAVAAAAAANHKGEGEAKEEEKKSPPLGG
jgi:hypothetical protein